MNGALLALLALALSAPRFGEAARPSDAENPPSPERGPMVETQLDRCYLGQPERFSEPP